MVVGVFGVLLSWLHLVSDINRIPSFAIFIPITVNLVLKFMKSITHIAIIIFAFSSAFHFLVDNEKEFNTIWSSSIKTLEWTLGELDYVDNIYKTSKYNVITSILFVVYITTIVGFIFNVYLMYPEDQLKTYKVQANFCRVNATLRLQLFIDDIFPSFRKKYARSYCQELLSVQKEKKWSQSRLSLKTEGNSNAEKYSNEIIDYVDISDLAKKIEELTEEFADLKNELKANRRRCSKVLESPILKARPKQPIRSQSSYQFYSQNI